MYFRLGNIYTHADNELSLVSTRTSELDQAGRPVQYNDRWVLNGQIQATGGVALLAAQQSLMTAYLDHNVRMQAFAGLYFTGGTPTSYFWNAFNTLGGIHCPQGPNFPRGDGQQWANARDYEIVLEAEFPAGLQSNTIEWSESVSTQGGGGQRIVGIENRYDRPVLQRVSRSTPVTYIQEGTAKGRYYYPRLPPALVPEYLNSPDCYCRRQTPRLRVAGGYGTQTDYVVSWRYVMILPVFRDAAPYPWNGS